MDPTRSGNNAEKMISSSLYLFDTENSLNFLFRCYSGLLGAPEAELKRLLVPIKQSSSLDPGCSVLIYGSCLFYLIVIWRIKCDLEN